MPCKKVKSGWRIRRRKGGLFPKVYKTLKACMIRVQQIETHKDK